MAKRLTPDDIDSIITMKLSRIPVRDIAARVGCTPKTVQERWSKHLKDRAGERAEAIEAEREESLQRLEQVAIDARLGALRARSNDDPRAESSFLTEERQALNAVAKLGGHDVFKIEASVSIGHEQVRQLHEAMELAMSDASLPPVLEEAFRIAFAARLRAARES